MIPRPPFASALTLEQELAEFEALKPRLAEVWDSISGRDEEPHTSVVVPSLTLDQAEMRKLEGASFYEERLLFLLIRLRNPRARVVFVTSQPVHPLVLEYYFQLLVGIPASHARSRLTLLCAHDATPRPLTEKILERPRLLERIRHGIADRAQAYLTVFNSTPLERRLAVLLGIPLNGVDPALNVHGTKSGSRKIFREAGIALPDGHEDLRDDHDIETALVELKKRNPALRGAVVKLNDSFSGEGNAIFRYPEAPGDLAEAVHATLPAVQFSVPSETWPDYHGKFRRMGGIAEAFLEAPFKASPSVQLRNDPHGGVMPISTHDQILGGPSGQVFLGCLFPAADGYRTRIQDDALQIGAVLAAKGVVSRFGIDFLMTREDRRPPGSRGPSRSTSAWAARRIPTSRSSSSRAGSSILEPAFITRRGARRSSIARRTTSSRRRSAGSCPRTSSRSSRSTPSTTATIPSRACCFTSSARSRSTESSG